MRYLDQFDTVLTGGSSATAESTLAAAHGELIVRLLHGDTITLSEVQSFDSTAWLRAAPALCASSVAVATIAVRGTPEPDTFIAAVADKFDDPGFTLSAWSKLDSRQRGVIASNIRRNKRFHGMLSNAAIDSTIAVSYSEQAAALENTLEYVANARGRLKRASTPSVRLWDLLVESAKVAGLQDLIRSVETMVNEREQPNLNNRSQLYRAIDAVDADPVEQRAIRKLTDRHYNHVVGDSVSNGRGAYSVGVSRQDRLDAKALDAAADAPLDSEFGQTHDVLFVNASEASSATRSVAPLHQVVDLLGKPEFQQSVQLLLADPASLHEHHNLIANELGELAQFSAPTKWVIGVGSLAVTVLSFPWGALLPAAMIESREAMKWEARVCIRNQLRRTVTQK